MRPSGIKKNLQDQTTNTNLYQHNCASSWRSTKVIYYTARSTSHQDLQD